MSKYRHSDKKIKELENEIKFLNKSLDFSRIMNKNLENNYDEVNKQRINYRRIIKYHTLLLILMNLLTTSSGNTDIDKIVKRNIMDVLNAPQSLVSIDVNDVRDLFQRSRDIHTFEVSVDADKENRIVLMMDQINKLSKCYEPYNRALIFWRRGECPWIAHMQPNQIS